MYTKKEIAEFAEAANSDLGSNKYKPEDLVIDYCKAIVIIQQFLKVPTIEEPILDLVVDMQYKLNKNKHKECNVMNPKGEGRGWDNCDLFWLAERIQDELDELVEALNETSTIRETQLECADIANFAMMVHDRLKERKLK